MSGAPSKSAAVLEVDKLHVRFAARQSVLKRLMGEPKRQVHALNGVSLQLFRGETLGIVGESGCGKSTLARAMVGLIPPDSGEVIFDGKDIGTLRGIERRRFNRRVQMIFQDPYGSLNPRMTVRQILTEALTVHRMRPRPAIAARVAELLDLVRLPPDAAEKLPHEFSGGQRQRIGIARALSVEPEILIADELVSALDVSVQAQVINLLLDLQERLKLTVLFVAHDLRLVRHLSHRVAVMYLGEIVEIGKTEELFAAPRHPYTRGLLDAAPDLDPARRSRVASVRGELPSPVALPSGCRFHPRCRFAFDRCEQEHPVLTERGASHLAACHLADFGRPQAVAADVDESVA
ncbi:MAG TPA: ABC transporter ATP-binding protein [Terriglobales bacterium]|nr:ABC transporter ATP-binding protein [Terriglobales bacterium]